MPQSDSSRTRLQYVKESTYGVPLVVAFKEIRFTGESLKADTGTVVSQEIRSDRQVTDVIRNAFAASGDISIEVSYGAHDELIEFALLSATWASNGGGTGTVYAVAGSPTNTITRSTGTWDIVGLLAVGDIITNSGFAQAGNNGKFLVTALNTPTSTVLTLLPLSGQVMVTESAGATLVYDEIDCIVNGTTLSSVAIEREYTDLTTTYENFKGMCVDQWGLTVSADQIVTGSFSFLGKIAASATTTLSNGTITAATTNPVLNGIDNVESFLIDGVAQPITSWTMQLVNNLRQRLIVGTLGAISVGTGSVDLTGTMQAYFETATLFDKYLGFSTVQMVIVFKQALNRYILVLPAVKFTQGQRVAGGINQDVIADLQWTAFRGATFGYTIKIGRSAI